MIGVIRIACAITIAVGVKSSPISPRGPARTAEDRRRPDHDRRQSHRAIEHHDQRVPPGETADGDDRTDGQTHGAGDANRGQADLQAQQNDTEQRRVAAGDQLKCLGRGGPEAVHRGLCNAGRLAKYVLDCIYGRDNARTRHNNSGSHGRSKYAPQYIMRLIPALTWAMEGGPDATLDARLVPLLDAIAVTGSLAAAVAERRMSYRAGWGLLRDCERAFGAPLVELQRGRGARLRGRGYAIATRTTRGGTKAAAKRPPGLILDLGPQTARGEPARFSRPWSSPRATTSRSPRCGIRRHRPSGSRLKLSFMGSLHALQQFAENHADAAGFHVALGVRNARDLAPFRRWLNPRRDRLIRFVDREQGLILPRGNPARVRNFKDIARKRLRFVNRQMGSGTRLLIDRIVAEEGLRPDAVQGYTKEEFTHPAIAATVASGGADAGFGLRAVAAERGLAFVPLLTERYYLAVRKAQLHTAGIATLLPCLHSPAFARLANGFAGYDAARAGTVVTVDALGTP